MSNIKAISLLIFGICLTCLAYFSFVRDEQTELLLTDFNGGGPIIHEEGQPVGPSAATIAPANNSSRTATGVAGTITFPDGSEVGVRWQRRIAANVPEPPYSRHYDSLRAEALAGDALASFSLYEILQSCNSSYDSEARLNEEIERLRTTYSIRPVGSEEVLTLSEPEDVESFVEVIEAQYENCSGITGQQRQEAGEWLKVSAAQGYDIAILFQAEEATSTEEKLRLVTQAWESGNAHGLRLLFHELQAAYDSGSAPENKIKAYASFFAFVQIMETAYADHGPIARRQLENERQKLAMVSSGLQEHELQQAEAMAKEMITNNHNCCYGL